MPKSAWEARQNFHLNDGPELVKTLKSNLANPLPAQIENIEEFNDKLKALNDAIQDTIRKHVELTKPSPYVK